MHFQALLDSRLGLLTGNAFLERVRGLAGLDSIEKIDAKWRVLLPVQEVAGRPNLNQQQHTKTLIIDNTEVFLGSANQDVATFEGDFREFSVSIRNSDAVTQSVSNFNSVFANSAATMPVNTFQSDKQNLLKTFTEGALNNAMLSYLKIRGARVGLIEADKTIPCD